TVSVGTVDGPNIMFHTSFRISAPKTGERGYCCHSFPASRETRLHVASSVQPSWPMSSLFAGWRLIHALAVDGHCPWSTQLSVTSICLPLSAPPKGFLCITGWAPFKHWVGVHTHAALLPQCIVLRAQLQSDLPHQLISDLLLDD